MPKFFVPSEQPFGSVLVLTGENAAHARVLRLKCGDSVTVCDAHGTDYACTVDSVQPGEVSLCVNASAPSASEPSVRCSVYMAYAKADKLEHVIQKATELGAAEIVAFPSARCVSRPDAKALKSKLELAEDRRLCGGAMRPGLHSVCDRAVFLPRGARARLPCGASSAPL